MFKPTLSAEDHSFYTTFSMKYHLMCKVYTDVGGIKQLYHVCPPVRKIIHSLKLVDYFHVQADNPWYNYYLAREVDLYRTFALYLQITGGTSENRPPPWSFGWDSIG